MIKTRCKLTDLDDKAKQYALKLLGYRGRSEKEMVERLRKKGISAQAISSTIRYLKNYRLLDDLILAESLKREALSNRLLSQAGARYFMLRRGISKNVVDSVLRDAENTDIETAERVVDKKLRVLRKYPAATIRRRLYQYLQRRGYSAGTIIEVLKDKLPKEEDQ
jgi:regulatory protein